MEKIGEGGEAEVFALDERRVLRRFRRDDPSIPRRAELTAEIAAGAGVLDVEVPEILDQGVDDDGRPWFVERRLAGRSMTDALGELEGDQRRLLVDSYLSTAMRLREITFERPWIGELIAEEPMRHESWPGYLDAVLPRQLAQTELADYPEIDPATVVDEVRDTVRTLPDTPPTLVHFDYFPGNVLCDDRRITAVIDWSVLAIMGDPDLDVALAVAYFGVTPTATADDVTFAWSWLTERGLAEKARVYERWGAAWWLPGSPDPTIRAWVAGVLGDQPE